MTTAEPSPQTAAPAPGGPTSGGPTPPRAERRDTRREHHGDVVVDHYEWLRDKEDPAVRAHLEAENAYAEAVTADLQPLRDAIFEEIRTRTQETDLSVPVASGPWWYYSRSFEGAQYSVECRTPKVDGAPRPTLAPDVPVEGEQVLLDGNEEAKGYEFFALGALTVSPDHRLLAYAVDTEGDERFSLRIKDLRTGVETSNVQAVMDGDLDPFVNGWLRAGCPTKRMSGIRDEEE